MHGMLLKESYNVIELITNLSFQIIIILFTIM
jgi:hypothetical protein